MREPDPFQSDPRERTENLVTPSVAGAMCAHIKEKILKDLRVCVKFVFSLGVLRRSICPPLVAPHHTVAQQALAMTLTELFPGKCPQRSRHLTLVWAVRNCVARRWILRGIFVEFSSLPFSTRYVRRP